MDGAGGAEGTIVLNLRRVSAPVIADIRLAASNRPAVVWASEVGVVYRAQASSNLVVWTDLTTNRVASGTAELIAVDPVGTERTRYVRVVKAPTL